MKATVDKPAKKVNHSKGKKGVEKPSVAALKKAFHNHILYTLAKDKFSATKLDLYKGLGLTVKDQLNKRWIRTQQTYYEVDAKRVYYISLEFLMGRLLVNNIVNLNLKTEFAKSLEQNGKELEDLAEMETDAGLGNGGLGRLAACFLDSMATMELPAYGYGIRYEYGIFHQHIRDGYQVETPDNWLRYGNIWEIERPEYMYTIKFGGKVVQFKDKEGILRNEWIDTQEVMAMAYDIPIPGYGNNTVNNLRLWSAKSTRDFDFDYFNHGDYIRAVQEKAKTETISKVLYPNDNIVQGKELRLKQEYFCVSATLQDILRRYLKAHDNFDVFADKVAIQLNDTHPAIAVAELMRILVDQHHLAWDKAWDTVVKTFGYTNHTVLPEALEKWPLSLLESVLPRHVQIIFEVNRRFLESVGQNSPGDTVRQGRMSLIEEGPEKNVRMAYLAVVGSHSVNGVAALHTEILKKELFKDFYEMFPERFNNKTNGITQRRWLLKCNPKLADLISKKIGQGWITDLPQLVGLVPFSTDKAFQKEWRRIKQENKVKLADYIGKVTGIKVNIDSIFDIQVKRIHEYKRQLLNLLNVVHMYNQIKANPDAPFVPRTVIFAGKAAPGYFLAKLIIKLINSVADVVNRDPEIGEKLKVVFLPNYCVSQAEIIIPGAELSEQTSTAGKEASGTGNMKFALNGALTIGTLDGANIEIKEEVGDENIFIFGLTAEEVQNLKNSGYNPMEYYERIPALKKVLDQIASGFFSPGNPELFKPIIESLLHKGDAFLLLADFEAYAECQKIVSQAYLNSEEWTRKSILNVAHIENFRAIDPSPIIPETSGM